MSVRRVLLAGFCSLYFVAIGTHARTPVPIINHENIAVVTAAGKTATAGQVRQAFITGGAQQGWRFEDSGANQLTGTLLVRGKHTVVINVAYGADNYSVTYKDSNDMKYGQRNGQPVIHPFYNQWVQTLIRNVGLELTRAQ